MPEDTPSIVHLGKNGAFVNDDARAAVDAIFTGPAAKPCKLVLYFHGGLDDANAGLRIAAKLAPVFTSAGAHPIFVVWESGLVEILRHNITEIAGEALFKVVLESVLKFTLGKFARSVGAEVSAGLLLVPDDVQVGQELARLARGEEPYADVVSPMSLTAVSTGENTELAQYLAQHRDFTETVQAVADSILPDAVPSGTCSGIPTRTRAAQRSLLSPSVVNELRSDVLSLQHEETRGVFTSAVIVRHVLQIFQRVVERFLHKRDHGLYPTVVEEILRELYIANAGMLVWGAMKGETWDAFQPATPSRGGQYVMEQLAKCATAGQYDITLVGHSTGAVFINHLLEYAKQERDAGHLPATFCFTNVILLAPASTYHDFEPFVAEPFGSGPAPLYRNLRVFAMTDDAECDDHLIPYIYPRSLLYFVSGVLEPATNSTAGEPDRPILGMQRFYDGADFGDGPALHAVRSFLGVTGTQRVVWAPTNRNTPTGLRSQARRHGDFDDDTETHASMVAIIAGEVTDEVTSEVTPAPVIHP